MPPKKSNGCNNCKDAVIPLWLKSVLKRWDDYFARFDRMFDLLVSMQQSHRAIVRKIDAIENRLFDQMSAAQANSDLYTTSMVDDRSTSDFDREAIKEIIDAACDNELMSQWKAGNIKIARAQGPSLGLYEKGRLSLTQTFHHSYARRDYTKEELDYDRQLRKRAGLLNANAGKLSYVVRDLAIHKLKTPRDLPRSISRSSSIEVVPTPSPDADRSPITSPMVPSRADVCREPIMGPSLESIDKSTRIFAMPSHLCSIDSSFLMPALSLKNP
ncbi:hypothetical protein COOONC_23880 [Cooperia oncophora]